MSPRRPPLLTDPVARRVLADALRAGGVANRDLSDAVDAVSSNERIVVDWPGATDTERPSPSAPVVRGVRASGMSRPLPGYDAVLRKVYERKAGAHEPMHALVRAAYPRILAGISAQRRLGLDPSECIAAVFRSEIEGGPPFVFSNALWVVRRCVPSFAPSEAELARRPGALVVIASTGKTTLTTRIKAPCMFRERDAEWRGPTMTERLARALSRPLAYFGLRDATISVEDERYASIWLNHSALLDAQHDALLEVVNAQFGGAEPSATEVLEYVILLVIDAPSEDLEPRDWETPVPVLVTKGAALLALAGQPEVVRELERHPAMRLTGVVWAGGYVSIHEFGFRWVTPPRPGVGQRLPRPPRKPAQATGSASRTGTA